ncbi:hypothetical protein, partial [Klebsiella pneumoniae]|uniref:hypothetical protein n=1 Tax=Klebsiella pneumoniae TaxID=573 RepID=UPI003EE284E4
MPKDTKKKTSPKTVTSQTATAKQVLASFKTIGARIEIKPRTKLKTKQDMALWYTPGVGTVSAHLAAH